MLLVIHCTDCGHDRIFSGINTNDLVLGQLVLETHTCECTHKCEHCEDLELAQATVEGLKETIRKLKLQLHNSYE